MVLPDAFDNDSSIGVDAAEVLQTVGEKGLKMGIATMSCEKDFIQRYSINRCAVEAFLLA